MAIACVQAPNATTSANQATVAVTITSSTAGNILVVWTGIGNSGAGYTVSSVTDNKTNTYTQASGAASVFTSGGGRSDIWYCLAPAAGVTTVTVTFGTSDTTHKVCGCWEISGWTGTPTFDTANKADNSTSAGSPATFTGASVTTATATGVSLGCMATRANIKTAPVAGNEYTLANSTGFSTSGATISRGWLGLAVPSAASHTPAWEDFGTGDAFCASTIAIKDVSSGGTITASVSDSITTTESVVMNLLNMPSVFDSITTTESTQMNLLLFPSVFDSVTATESVVMNLLNMPSVFDTVTATEFIGTNLLNFPFVFDAVTATESVSMNLLNMPNVFEAITTTESVTMNVILMPSVFDAVTADDATVSVQLNPILLDVFDTVTTTENVSVVGGTLFVSTRRNLLTIGVGQ